MGWLEEKKSYQDAGFTEKEIFEEEQRQRSEMFRANFNSDEIDEYFGVKKFDPTEFKKLVDKNLEEYRSSQSAEGAAPKEATSFWEAVEAGLQISVSGLAARGKMPDLSVSEDSGMFYRIANQVGTLVGDVPAMLGGMWAGGAAGSAVGGAVGSAVPVVGTAAGGLGGGILGAGGGSFALPTAMRKILMDHYEKGDVKGFGDFWERASATFVEASKGFVVGAATSGVGGAVGKVAAPLVKAGTTATVRTASEIATMVTVGKALEGDVPEPQDFIDAAVVVGGLHGVAKVSSKFRKVYGEFGIKPEVAAPAAAKDPLVKQEMLARNTNYEKVGELIIGEKLKVAKPPLAEPEIPVSKFEPATELDARIMSSIGTPTAKPKEPYSVARFRQDYVDRLDPIVRLEKALTTVEDGGKVGLAANESPQKMFRLASDYKSKLRHVLEKGTLEFSDLSTNGKPLKEIFSPIKKDLELFEGYLKARGSLDYFKRGLKTDISEADATAFVKKYKAKFETQAKEFTEWNNRNLEYLQKSGRFTPEEFQIIKEANENYVPMKRLLEAEDGSYIKPTREGFLKERTGSDAKTQSPIRSAIENAEVLFKQAEKNRATNTLVEFINQFGDESVATQVKGHKGKLQNNQIETYRNGQREVYQFADKSIAEAVKSLDMEPISSGIFMKIARNLTVAKKIGISLTPEFIARNFVRDQLTSFVFSNSWHIPVIDTVFAMKDVVTKSDAYYAWLKSGGANGSFLGINESYFKKDLLKLNEKTGFMNSTWNIAKDAAGLAKLSASLVEEATRVGEFKRLTKGETSGPKVFEGGYASREITVDFNRIGRKMAAANAITAFQNVSIQGLDRTFRALQENPRAMSSATALITTASVALWVENRDQDWYKEVPQWEKDLFWHMEVGGVIFRIPKPQELGVMFGSVPERVLEAYVNDNPNAFKEMSETLGGLAFPSLVPDAIATPAEQMVNRSFFTGNPIVSQAAEKLLPAYQFNDYTSESAKAIGKLIDFIPYIKDIGPDDAKLASPMVVENYVRGWTGTLGMYVLKAVDLGLVTTGAVKDQKPSGTLADMPFIKAFVTRYPHANTQSIQNFREKYKKAERVFSTIKQLGSKGQLDEAMEVAQMYEGDMIRLTNQKEALTNMHKAIQGIYMSDYTKDEKRQLIDSVYFQMIAVARDGNAMLNDMEKAISKRKFQNRLRLP